MLCHGKAVEKATFFRLYQGIMDTMNLLAKTQGVTLDQKTLAADAADIVRFDHLLALTYRFVCSVFLFTYLANLA